MMNSKTFRDSLSEPSAPPALSSPLQGLWLDAKDRWDDAHRAVQSDQSTDAAWVHAYLHRKEGDLANARHWYSKAGKQPADGSLSEEWASICESLLSNVP